MKRLPLLFIIVAVILQYCNRANQVTSQGGGDVVTTGKVYLPDGTYASNCIVTAVPSNTIPGSETNIPTTMTDGGGQFSFKDMPLDTYNLFAKKGDFAVCRKNVIMGNPDKVQALPNDTLKPVGSLNGVVRLSASTDSRNVLILLIGGTTVKWPNDSSGYFSIPELAEGTYRFRFLALDYQYDILDTSFTVISGKSINVGTVLLSKTQ